MGEQPPKRSSHTVTSTPRSTGRRNGGPADEAPLEVRPGEQSVVFVCSNCGERFMRRQDLHEHQAEEERLPWHRQHRLRQTLDPLTEPARPEALAQAAAAVSAADLRASAEARLAFGVLFAACFALYAVGRALQTPYLALCGELGVLFFGLGAAPLQLSRSARLAARLGVAALVMLSAMSLLGAIMVLEPLGAFWRPFLWAAAALVAAALIHVLGVRQAVGDLARTGLRLRAVWGSAVDTPGRGWAPLTAIVLGTAAWLTAAITAGHITPGIGGFLPRIAPVWYAGLVTLVLGVFLAHRTREAWVTLAVASLAMALTVTPALVYGMPRAQSAGKHIEFVQLILTQHRLSTGSGIYAAYSAFFAGVAWLCSVARVTDVTALATWWPVFVGALGLIELRFLVGRIGLPAYRTWVAVLIAVLVNAIGADYFSPQSIGFVMGLGIYALVFEPRWPALGGEPLSGEALSRQILGGSALSQSPPVGPRLRAIALLLSGVALATTHELSPFIIGGVLVVLTAFGLARPRWAAAAVLVPAVLWAGVNFDVVSGFVSFGFLLHLSNFRPPRTVASPGLSRQLIVAINSRALLLGLLVLIVAALASFVRNVRRRWAWAFVLCTAVGLVCVAVNPYGNEGIYRAALFGIPWLTLLAARGFDGRVGRRRVLLVAGVALLLCATFLVANFGMDASNVVRRSDLSALRVFERESTPTRSFLLEMGYGDFPCTVPTVPLTRRYVALQTAVGSKPLPLQPTAADLAALTAGYEAYARAQVGPGQNDLYATWSLSLEMYSYEYGLLSKRQSTTLRDLMLASPDWRVVYRSQGTILFKLIHA
jgi:hypothetical protein